MLEVGYDKAASDNSGIMGMLMALLATKKEGKELWAVLLFIVFVIIILIVFAVMFTRRDRDGGLDGGMAGIAPVLAASVVANQRPNYDGGYSHGYNYMMAHDGQRDNLKEFGEIKKEIVCTKADTDAKTAHYFYETQRNIDCTKFDGYKATKESEEKVLLAIAESERRAAERAEREKDAKIAHQAMLLALCYRAPVQGNYANIQQIDAGGGYAYC